LAVQFLLICSGGFRIASTAGYYLRALRADGPAEKKKATHDGCEALLD